MTEETPAGPPEEQVPRRRRRRHRRVVAPPTNPAADPSDDVPGPRSERGAKEPGAGRPKDGREAWILEQRPPHWD
ncbi:hypothetical protein GCM10009584_15570 [Ornithinimicrobium humiphilum]|uniref:Uncharacterized protein n=1 Tax=Ornithinimicrobium humiphilum TaxID=125288 RepID=A0A543KKU7_9MICO|nr:hypothetical protein [Ornithinimicrobium humiphilum]TQM95650.1 hypothetical protein FB476_0496 [Ornithinimicrobium humiphilum]